MSRVDWTLSDLGACLGDCGLKLRVPSSDSVPSLSCCVILGIGHNLSELLFPSQQSRNNTCFGWVQWLTPVIPALWEAEVGRSPEARSLRPAWPTGHSVGACPSGLWSLLGPEASE
ncbi:putative uncharacterized protein C8orf44, partial [Plecturocebus cupreus]